MYLHATIPLSIHQKQVLVLSLEIEVCVCCKTNVSDQILSTRQTSPKVYLGLSETPFKDRYRNDVRDFNNKIHYNKAELSKCRTLGILTIRYTTTRLNFPNVGGI